MGSVIRDTEELRWLCQRRWGVESRWRCVYCGDKPARRLQVDHFNPIGTRASHMRRNLVPACQPCNAQKSDRDPAEWMQLVGVPELHAAMLLAIYELRDWRAPRDLVIPRTSLDYAAGKNAPRRSLVPRSTSSAVLESLDVPNCPNDLVAMQPSGDGSTVHWRCPECGLTQL